jgi:hypothetical protein
MAVATSTVRVGSTLLLTMMVFFFLGTVFYLTWGLRKQAVDFLGAASLLGLIIQLVVLLPLIVATGLVIVAAVFVLLSVFAIAGAQSSHIKVRGSYGLPNPRS